MRERYKDRLIQLGKVGQKLGPFVFNRVDLYAAEPAPDEPSAEIPGFYVQHVAYPQIDNPHSMQAIAWNKQNVRAALKPGVHEYDEETDYDAGYANSRFISVLWHHRLYYHGANDVEFEVEGENVILTPTPHPMICHDIFGPDDRWIKRLRDLYWIRYRNILRLSAEGPVGDFRSTVDPDIIKPNFWLVDSAGLTVAFSAYEGGCRMCTPPPVKIPWSDLKPFLSPSAVVP